MSAGTSRPFECEMADQMLRLREAMRQHGEQLGWIKLADRAHNLATSQGMPQDIDSGC